MDHELANDMSSRVVPGGDGATVLCLRRILTRGDVGVVAVNDHQRLADRFSFPLLATASSSATAN